MNKIDVETKQILQGFVSEAEEHLAKVESFILKLEKVDETASAFDEIFRSVHSIKGATGMFGITGVEKLAHTSETFLNFIRDEGMKFDSEDVDLLLHVVELLKQMILKVKQSIASEEAVLADCEDLVDKKLIQKLESRTNQKKQGKKDTFMISEGLLTEFKSEAKENIEIAENCILNLDQEEYKESKEKYEELINELFRAIHSLKGSSSYLNFDRIAKLAHIFENEIDHFRKHGDLRISKEAIDLYLVVLDILKALLPGEDRTISDHEYDKVYSLLKMHLANLRNPDPSPIKLKEHVASHENEISEDDVFLDQMEQFTSTLNYFCEQIKIAQLSIDQLKAVSRIVISIKNTLNFKNQKELVQQVTEHQVQLKAAINAEDISSAQKHIQDVAMIVSAFVKSFKDSLLQEAKSESEFASPVFKSKSGTAESSKENKTIRVEQTLLDTFINSVGELIVVKNTIEQILRNMESQGDIKNEYFKHLREATKGIIHISEEMQRNTMKMRMIPVKNLFQKFPRLVRDVTRKNGKLVELHFEGEETEIDKGIAEEITDPLVHMVRNSLDHGLEIAADRLANGKLETGRIILKAKHEGNFIVLEVVDDGRGIDPKKVMRKAIEKKMISEAQAEVMSDQQLIALIFEPGFSTAEAVTDISGRGVGMDVVMTNIKKVHGKVTVQSEVGKGCTIRLQLPLTMAVLDTLLVESANQIFAIPIQTIQETVKIKTEDFKSVAQQKVINIRGDIVGVQSLKTIFKIESKEPDDLSGDKAQIILIIRSGRERFGVAVDRVLRQEEVVVKPVPKYYEGIPGIAGASVLGDGRAILIVDSNKILDDKVHKAS